MDQSQARDSLEAISIAQRKTLKLRNYRDGGSVVAAWGIVWFLGYSAQQFLPQASAYVWLAGWVGALGWTLSRPKTAYDIRALATWGIAVSFVFLLLIALRADERIAALTFGLVLAASYAALGVWSGKRFLILGLIVLASTCFGWWLAPDWLFAALAVGGGAGMVVGGMWLHRP